MIHLYYLRFAKLINDMNMIGMTMQPLQVNTKFVNKLQPEWSKFVTDVKLAKDMHTTNFDQLYAYLRQHEVHADEATISRSSCFGVIQNTRNAITNLSKVIRCYNCRGEGHIARQCTQPKRVQNLEWFKEKMPLAQAQEAGVTLDEEHIAFLEDKGERVDSDPTAQALTNNDIFQTDGIDAFDSDVDEAPTESETFMENLFDYGSDVLSEKMSSQVAKCNVVNLENKTINESLIAELQIAFLEDNGESVDSDLAAQALTTNTYRKCNIHGKSL
ncbi:retrovirus-related pol polyprotein from transposon TNT 1-94 [Tanacetum coccineum]